MSAPCPLNPVLPGGVLLFMPHHVLISLMFCLSSVHERLYNPFVNVFIFALIFVHIGHFLFFGHKSQNVSQTCIHPGD